MMRRRILLLFSLTLKNSMEGKNGLKKIDNQEEYR